MKKPQILACVAVLFFGVQHAKAQVGIGTTTPTAQLTIDAGSSGIAPLELTNTTTAPTHNLSGGQIAVINNELYFFEPTRSHWFSVTTIPITFARNGNVNNSNLYFGGRITNQNSGAPMLKNGTIIGVSATSSGGSATKRFELRVRNDGSDVSVTDLSLSDNELYDDTLNIDFSEGDTLTMRARNDGDGDVSNPSIILWIKWRE
ncbi:hypothetical protein [Gilvibacter sp.]|uniref:hypothetical protein n=1 Tax=Gilvibacter sp. TaxID=2729997 RepID=UPI0025BCE48B|nr:hypothetical protein [Gilvibacter sp.]NQX77054.1 hypothetical protein [Gilvibacter sp.]